MLHRFGMENAKPSSTPMDPDVYLDNPVCEDRPADTTLGREIACTILWQEAIWFKRLTQEMLLSTLDAVEIGCNNQGALKLLETGIVQAKTKHIDVKYHHIGSKGYAAE
jgi:hypothetical protein